MIQINTIKGLENIKDYYHITTCGKVYSTHKKGLMAIRGKNGRYPQAHLMTIDGKGKYIEIHRLVALAYIPNPDNKPQVNHIDEVKTNNYIGNLNWMTVSENNDHGTRKERSSTAVIQMKDGEVLATYVSIREAANAIGLKSLGGICSVCRGTRKNAGGYQWRYADDNN